MNVIRFVLKTPAYSSTFYRSFLPQNITTRRVRSNRLKIYLYLQYMISSNTEMQILKEHIWKICVLH